MKNIKTQQRKTMKQQKTKSKQTIFFKPPKHNNKTKTNRNTSKTRTENKHTHKRT